MNHHQAPLVTTQAREGIETTNQKGMMRMTKVTTQAHEGIETRSVQYTFAIT